MEKQKKDKSYLCQKKSDRGLTIEGETSQEAREGKKKYMEQLMEYQWDEE